MNGTTLIFILLILETVQDNDFLFLTYTFLKGLMMKKSFELSSPVTTKLFVTRQVNGTTCVDIDNYIPDLQFISSLRIISGWLHAAVNLSDSTIISCRFGGESVRVPSEVLSIYNLAKTIQGSTQLSEVTNQMKTFVSVDVVTCESSLPVRTSSLLSDWVMETTFTILRMMEMNCSTIPQFDFTPPIEESLPSEFETNNTCLINARNSARMYLFSPHRMVADLPLIPDICLGLKNNTTSLTNLLPSSVSISDSGRLISIPSIRGPVNGTPETQEENICSVIIRGNEAPCQGLDIWSCFSAAGCYVEWSSGNCIDCPAGFFCGDKGNEINSCNSIPSDQSFTGIAWTDPDCPSKCTDPLYMMSDENKCVKITSFGVYADPCDSRFLLPCVEKQDYYTQTFTVFPTMGSCRNSYLLNLLAVGINPPARLFTISFWFNFASYNSTLFGLAENALTVSTTPSGQLNVDFLGDLLTLTYPIPQGWNHLICYFTSGEATTSLELHLNGMHALTRTATKVLTPSPHIFIGPLLDNEAKLYSGIEIYDFQVFQNVTPNAKLLFASSASPSNEIRPQQCKLGSEVSPTFCKESTLNPTIWEIFNSTSQTTPTEMPIVSMVETTTEAFTETVHPVNSTSSYPTTTDIINLSIASTQNLDNITTLTASKTTTQDFSGDIGSTTNSSDGIENSGTESTTSYISYSTTETAADSVVHGFYETTETSKQENPTTWDIINNTASPDLASSFIQTDIAGTSYQDDQFNSTGELKSTTQQTTAFSPDQTTSIYTVILLTTGPPTSHYSTTNDSDALATTDDATFTDSFPEVTATPSATSGLVENINSTGYMSTSLTDTSFIASSTILRSTDQGVEFTAFSSTASPSDDAVSFFDISTVKGTFPTSSWILPNNETTLIATSCNAIQPVSVATMTQAIEILSTTLQSSSTETHANRSYTGAPKNNSSNAFADQAGRPPGLQKQNYLNHEPPLIESYRNLIMIASCVTASLILLLTVGATLYMHLRRRMTRQVISV